MAAGLKDQAAVRVFGHGSLKDCQGQEVGSLPEGSSARVLFSALTSLCRQFCHGAERRVMARPNALDRCRAKLLTHSLVHGGEGRRQGSLAESFSSWSPPALPESDGKARVAAFARPEAEHSAEEGGAGQEAPGKTALPVYGGDRSYHTFLFCMLSPLSSGPFQRPWGRCNWCPLDGVVVLCDSVQLGVSKARAQQGSRDHFKICLEGQVTDLPFGVTDLPCGVTGMCEESSCFGDTFCAKHLLSLSSVILPITLGKGSVPIMGTQ